MQGDQAAFASLYDESSRFVYYVILMIVHNREDAEEVTLDVYTKVWNNVDSYNEARGGVRRWLIVLARSRAIDRIRSQAWRQQRAERDSATLEFSAPGLSPEGTLLHSECRARLGSALMTLAPAERKLLVLAFFHGHSHRELAELVQQPLGTVKTRIRNSMIKLRHRLSSHPARALSA